MLEVTLDKPGQFSSRDAPEPTTREGEALVRVQRIGVCGTDLHAFAGRQPFFEYPRILGHELGVEIIAVGENERGLRAGDRCAIEPSIRCGTCIACRRGRVNCCENLKLLGVHIDGGMRPLLSVPLFTLHKSDTLSLDQLALVETLAIGAHAVGRADPSPDETVLVIGAGPIGLTVMQFLRTRGVRIITADVNDQRLAFCRDTLGIEHTINAASDDLGEAVRRIAGDLPTLVMDATGHPASMAETFNLVAHGGRIVFVGLVLDSIRFDDANFHKREITLLATRNSTPDEFRHVIAEIEAGRIDTTPWITHRMGLTDVVDHFAELPGKPGLIKAMIDTEGA